MTEAPQPHEIAATDHSALASDSVNALIAAGAVPRVVVQALRAAELRAQSADDARLRTLAETDNQRKRLARTQEAEQRLAQERVLNLFLPVWDSLARSLSYTYSTRGAGAATLEEGVSLTLSQFTAALKELGVQTLDVHVGQAFDPSSQEAVLRTRSNAVLPGHVAAVLQTGFSYQGRLLRPAKVAVAGE